MSHRGFESAGRGIGRNRSVAEGGPNGVQRSYASEFKESEPLFDTYEHLKGLPRGDSALQLLRKIASIVKPIMRKHRWHVKTLAEFLPSQQNLLGLNYNMGAKICIRLRYHHNPDLFLPLDELVDTMLHELCHNIWGEHDSNFHRLWDELRDEHEVLQRKGYTGEGFLSAGRRLGGYGNRMPPSSELRRLARASAEQRQAQGTLSAGSGRRLGGTPLHLQGDIRQVIANQATRRNTINQGCGSGRGDAGELLDQAASNTFRTEAEEDDANNRAIAEALVELMEQEEAEKLSRTFQESSVDGTGLSWDPNRGLYDPRVDSSGLLNTHYTEEEQLKWAMEQSSQAASVSKTGLDPPKHQPHSTTEDPHPPVPLSSKPKFDKSDHSDRHGVNDTPHISHVPSYNVTQDEWTCSVCTCINPMQFLACDACGSERALPGPSRRLEEKQPPAKKVKRYYDRIPPPKSDPDQSIGWNCSSCGAFMEHKWWTCSACGRLKDSS